MRWHALLWALLLVPVGARWAGAADREPLLDGRIRPGWQARGTRGLAVSLTPDGALLVQPNDRTRAFATALLAAAPGASVNARENDYLTFEINTLPGAGGRHRAPGLRVGLADASGRTRQPGLARFVQLDTDPTTWQPALIPIPQLLDRGGNKGAIASVSWQYAGPAAPFAVRRVALLAALDDSGAAPGAQPASAGPPNLVPDPSFERRRDARPIWSTIGDYRDLARPGERTLERGAAAHGRRFLRLQGTRAYFFEALAPRTEAVGFAVALASPGGRPGAGDGEPDSGVTRSRASRSRTAGAMVEIGCEVAGFGRSGGVMVGGRAVRTVPLEAGWRRHAVSAAVNPSDMPPDDASLRLYRGWIRPLAGDAVVNVDAVHLAPGPVEPEAFGEERANSLSAGTGLFRQVRGLMGFRPPLGETDQPTPPGLQVDLPPLSVPLVAREWAGRAWERDTIAGGVPLARGLLYSPDALRLRGPDGRDIPFQREVLRRDPRDGSVRCLWIAFQGSLPANQEVRYSLESGATTAFSDPPLARDAGDEVILNTGAFRMRLARKHFPLFTEAEIGGAVVAGGTGGIRLELLDGRALTSLGAPSHVTVERNGPLSAVIAVGGFLAAADDRPAPRFLYQARLRAWKGVPGLQVDVAVTNLTPEPATPVRSLSLVVPLGSSSHAEADIGRQGSDPLSALPGADGAVRLTQIRDPYRAGREDLVVEVPEKPPGVRPGRAAGWARWQAPGRAPVVLALGRMADRHPCALEVRPGSLAAYLVPPAGAGALDFPFGLTLYGECWIGVGEAPDLVLDRLQQPPLLSAEPAHVVASGVFRPFALPDEAAHDFPFLSGILTRTMALWRDDRERLAETGWLNDGDTGGSGAWRHGEPDTLENFYLEYLRTGEPRARERARRQALHQREVCAWWSNESSAFHHPGGGAHVGYGLDPERFWGSGLLSDYWLTGDRRSLEVAEALGAELLSRAASPHYRGAERGRLLLHLAELYAATGRRAFREAYERHLRYSGAPDTRGYAGGLTVCALREGMAGSDDEALSRRFQRAVAALGDSIQAQRPFSRLLAARDSVLYRAFSAAAPDALARPAWEALLEHMLWLSLGPGGQDPALARAVHAFRPLGPMGLPPPPWAAGSPLGIAPFSGHESRFTVRIHRRGSQAVSLTVCRLRAEPLDITRLYRVHISLRDPTGKRVLHRILEGGAFVADTLSLPRGALAGDYELSVACSEDGIAEVVSAHPRVFVRADEWKASRYCRGQARFYLRGPRSGEVRISVRGRAAHDGDGVIGATLRAAPDGTVLARARWSVPMAGSGEDGSAPERGFPAESLRLPSPPEHRGRPLALEVTAPKGVAWRVEGLDDPWLAATPQAFE